MFWAWLGHVEGWPTTQPYDICLSKPRMDLTAPSKTMLGNVVAPVTPTKTEAIDTGTSMAVPGTALMDISS